MSPDPPDALKRFREKYDLHFTFLSDPDHGVLEQYGAWGERPGRGPGVIRSTVLLGPDGTVQDAWYRVTADGHAASVLQTIEATEAAGSR
jgi:peroxiredoxin Q/BCP